ncbi:MAG TPA: adenylate/guanylate cyclase domain-containing protein [Baekduia sp.]|nr:adenylate/guanylate cyclase domain-containing protein [Baekduia sp.]
MRVRRTFGFLDLCGFTSFTDVNGDARAVVVLSHLRRIIRTHAEERGVRVTKWLGDGAMLSGVEPEAVIACALAVREDVGRDGHLALRGGLCEGEVIMFEGDDYIGAAVNLAARLCRQAGPGELLITAALASRLPSGLEAVPLGGTSIDGLAERVEVLALQAPARS